MGTLADKLQYLKDTKDAIMNAIIEKGVAITASDTFRSYADKIREISGGGGITPEIGKYPKHEDYKSGYTIVGSDVTVNSDGIASGFSTTSYIKANYIYDALPTDEMEMHFSAKRDNTVLRAGVFCSLGPRKFCGCWIHENNAWQIGASDGSSDNWNILPLTSVSAPNTMATTDKIKFKIVKGTGTGISAAYNFDDSNFYQYLSTPNLSSNTMATNFEIGLGTNRGLADGHHLVGTMDLKDAFILKNGKVIWEAIEGSHTYS